MANVKPLRLRSYTVLSEEPINCTIVEAARATSAAPTFFDPVRINNGATLRDGGMLNNNPIEELVNEVTTRREFRDKEISCIVSIGTGMLKQNILGDSLAIVAKNCAKIAKSLVGFRSLGHFDCEYDHDRGSLNFSPVLSRQNKHNPRVLRPLLPDPFSLRQGRKFDLGIT
jgi:Patatin-like phospholipase